ncbi:hypothetical protein CAI21_22080 [Alkalilimnicola ehrlichii]|nr:hypothetical protein CAI21_22080 [Alkalilimnicola ehrlichii]
MAVGVQLGDQVRELVGDLDAKAVILRQAGCASTTGAEQILQRHGVVDVELRHRVAEEGAIHALKRADRPGDARILAAAALKRGRCGGSASMA